MPEPRRHEWIFNGFRWPVCRVCGVAFRGDKWNRNAECPGPAKVVLR